MSGVLGLGIVVLLIVAIAAVVIGAYALRRHPRDQWGARVKTASHMVLDGVGLPRVDGQVPVREVSFDDMWANNARHGNAYLEIPSLEPLEDLVDRFESQLRSRGAAADGAQDAPAAAAAAAAAELPERPPASSRFLRATSISAWRDRHEGSRDQDESERTVA